MSVHKTPIEWCDYAVNPIRFRDRATGKVGWFCVKVAEGCKNCYAAALNKRLGTGHDYVVPNFELVEPFLDERTLHHMLTFKPRGPFKGGSTRPRVFVEDMSDMFGDWVPDEWLDRIYAVFALRPDVDWIVLTKRPEQALAYTATLDYRQAALELVREEAAKPEGLHRAFWEGIEALCSADDDEWLSHKARWEGCTRMAVLCDWTPPAWDTRPSQPLENAWLGTSVATQADADKNVPVLLDTPAALRWVSLEPQIERVELRHHFGGVCDGCGALLTKDNLTHPAAPGYFNGHVIPGELPDLCGPVRYTSGIGWVVQGGESGREARSFRLEWAYNMRDQCAAAGVPYFFKQAGSRPMAGSGPNEELVHLRDPKGGDPAEWPWDLRVRQFPEGQS